MTYNQETIVEKNITLSFEFERYILEHPEMLEQIPDGAQVVLLPQDDPELYRINLNAAQKARQAGETVPIVYVEIEALAPPTLAVGKPAPDHGGVITSGHCLNVRSPSGLGRAVQRQNLARLLLALREYIV